MRYQKEPSAGGHIREPLYDIVDTHPELHPERRVIARQVRGGPAQRIVSALNEYNRHHPEK